MEHIQRERVRKRKKEESENGNIQGWWIGQLSSKLSGKVIRFSPFAPEGKGPIHRSDMKILAISTA